MEAAQESLEEHDPDLLEVSGEEVAVEGVVDDVSSKIYVDVIETPTGWLNVRSGPGTNFEQVSRVDVGEKFELLEEDAGWYKIKIDDETEGWVYAEYATTTKE